MSDKHLFDCREILTVNILQRLLSIPSSLFVEASLNLIDHVDLKMSSGIFYLVLCVS